MEGICGVVGDRRRTLLDEMSALPGRRNSLAGLTLDAVLTNRREDDESRTLFDIIREDPTSSSLLPHNKDRKSWKLFRDKLRLKRAGSAWTSSVHIPASDIIPLNVNRRASVMSADNSNSNNNRGSGSSSSSSPRAAAPAPEIRPPVFVRRSSTRFTPGAADPNHDDAADISRPADVLPSRSFKPRHGSPRLANRDGDEINPDPFDLAREGTRRLAVALADERAMSAREAIAAQEAAAAQEAEQDAEESLTAQEEREEEGEDGGDGTPAGAGAEGESSEGGQPVRMSLMDLLEETDREMGVEGSKYMMGEDDEEFEEEDEEEEAEAEAEAVEYNCCICMVRHKGAAFIPCGHTFCRLCSRELWVQRGNCPLCNNFIIEILDIF